MYVWINSIVCMYGILLVLYVYSVVCVCMDPIALYVCIQ